MPGQPPDPYAEFGGSVAPGPWRSGLVTTPAPAKTASVDPYAEFGGSVAPADNHSVTGFLGNAVTSGANLAGNVIKSAGGALEAPIRTAYNYATGSNVPATPEEKGVTDLGQAAFGALEKPIRNVMQFATGRNIAPLPEEQKTDAVVQGYKDRYGSLKQLGETAYHDPAGTLADAAMLTGGAAGTAGTAADLADAANLTKTAGALRTAGKGAALATEYNPLLSVPSKVVPAAIKGAKTVVGNYLDRVVDPHVTMIQALRPTASRTNWDKSIAVAMPDIKAAEAATGRPITDVDTLLDAVGAAKRLKRAQLEQYTTPAQRMGLQVDLTPVAKAMEDSIPETVRFENTDPTTGRPTGEYKSLLEQAAFYRNKVPIEQAEKFLGDTNAALDAYYAKYPGARRAQLRANPETAALVKKGDALRDVFYNGLDNPSLGAVPREINRRYGALTDIEDTALRRKNVAARLAPQSLTEQFANIATAGRVARAIGKVATFHPLEAVGELTRGAFIKATAKWMKEHQQTNNLIRRAFKNYDVPSKQFPGPAPVPPRGPRPVQNFAGQLNNALPAATSGIGVSGVIAPNMAGTVRTGTNRLTATYQLPAPGAPIPAPPPGGPPSAASGVPRGVPNANPRPWQQADILDDQGNVLSKAPLPATGERQPPLSGVAQPPTQGTGNTRKMRPSTVSGPGAKTVGPKTPYPMPPAGTFKNPYR